MRKFFLFVALFCIPIIFLLIGLEFAVHTIPNSYKYKYNYVKTKGETIKAVAIGHSQFYDDFKADEFYIPAFNLSNSAQGYMEDYYILEKLLPSMPNLEMILLPIGYMSVGREEQFTQKSCYYYEYMGIDYEGKIPLQYRLESLFVRSSVKKILSYYMAHDDIVRCDTLGWSPHFIKDRKKELGFNNVIDIYTLDDSLPFFLAGEDYLLRILEMTSKSNIKVVMVSPPLFWKGYKRTNWGQKRWVDQYIQRLCLEHPSIQHIDMEFDSSFVDKDFYDESHLSELGSVKFMKKLNTMLLENN